jgi:hypothetical protein
MIDGRGKEDGTTIEKEMNDADAKHGQMTNTDKMCALGCPAISILTECRSRATITTTVRCMAALSSNGLFYVI